MSKINLYKNKNRLLELLKADSRWLKIPGNRGKLIVLSDLHNDGRTLHLIIDTYLTNSNDAKIVICGDFGDRSPSSWLSKPTATLDYLLKLKLKYTDRLFMLMGNHDLNPTKHQQFMPCEFWSSLSEQDETLYTEILEALPVLATTENGVIMTHGVLPSSPAFFDNFRLGGPEFMECLWSDYTERTPTVTESIRKQKGLDEFHRSMKAFDSKLLIKGHNPYAPLQMFDNRCVTLQTTRVFEGICDRHIAIIDLEKPVHSADDVELINLDQFDEVGAA